MLAACTGSAGDLLNSRISPFQERLVFPGIREILTASMLASSTSHTKSVECNADLLIRPNVRPYTLFDWLRLDEIIETGYQDTMSALEALTTSDPYCEPS